MSSYDAARAAVPLVAIGRTARIESRLVAQLVDCLNAEVVVGGVGTIDEASRGLRRRPTTYVSPTRHGPGERIDGIVSVSS